MFLRLAFAVATIFAISSRAEEEDLDDLDFDAPEGEGDMAGAEEALLKQSAIDFEAMDMDKDGKLSVKDLEEYLNDPSTANEIKEFMEKADKDADGFVTLEDYIEFVKSVLQDHQANGGEEDFMPDDLDFDDEEL
jgi:hypothetical protein